MVNNRKNTIAVVTYIKDADMYIFNEHEEALRERNIDVSFEFFDSFVMRQKDFSYFLGYKGVLVHPGMSIQSSTLAKLQMVNGLKYALYTMNIGDSEIDPQHNVHIFDITDLEGIINHFNI